MLHIPDEYDYRYASPDKREKIILSIIKGWVAVNKAKIPIHFKEELSLVNHAMTKDEKKKNASKDLGKGEPHDEESYRKIVEGEEATQQEVRKTTKTLFAKDSKETVSLADFIPKLVLGKGAFGTVLLVEKKNTKDLYAMKSITKEDIVKKQQLEHTKTEKMVLEHVNHPFLVGLAYAFQTPAKLYFIMQFMSKCSPTQRGASCSSTCPRPRSSRRRGRSSTSCRSHSPWATSTSRTSSTETSNWRTC